MTAPARRHESLGLFLRLVHQHWSQAIDARLEEAGFTNIRPPHANVFTFVPPEGIQVSELTRLAQVRKQTMAQAVAELEELGYVERRPDPNDRRAKLVFLTERGAAVRPTAMTTGHEVEAHWADLTSPEDIATLKRLLAGLLTQLQAEYDTEPEDDPSAGAGVAPAVGTDPDPARNGST